MLAGQPFFAHQYLLAPDTILPRNPGWLHRRNPI